LIAIAANSLLSASEQIVPSVGTEAGWKPRAVDRLRKASRRSRSAAELNPHHAGDAYDDCGLKTIGYVERLSAGHDVEECTVQTATVHTIQVDS